MYRFLVSNASYVTEFDTCHVEATCKYDYLILA